MHNFLKANNFNVINDCSQADVIIISTCAFCNFTERLSIKVVKEYAEKYNNKEIIVTGCLPKINPESLDGLKVTSIGFTEMDEFNDYFKAKVKIEDIDSNVLGKYYPDGENDDKYFVHICQGCINSCSYCAIKKAKGYVKSKPIAKILKEVNQGVKLGYKKIVLLSDDGGSYGLDIGIDLSELILKIIDLPDKSFQLIVQNIFPQAMISLFPRVPQNVFKRFHSINIPVQSLNSRILKLMNRDYDIKKVIDIVNRLKSINPDIHLRTEVIYGFPSETRQEFYKDFELGKYFECVIFRTFSNKKGTRAIKFKDKIGIEELEYRTNKLIDKFEEIPQLQLASKYEAIFNKKHPKLK
ncbi:MAG: radical SAM protein [Candidatus Portnoybacteria bacterium]|nr:radical SAM protein [Candidatus Portnoybacteria bacterium]